MVDQRSRGGKKQGTSNPSATESRQTVRSSADRSDGRDEDLERERQMERDRQNQDDPSQAPESGDRK